MADAPTIALADPAPVADGPPPTPAPATSPEEPSRSPIERVPSLPDPAITAPIPQASPPTPPDPRPEPAPPATGAPLGPVASLPPDGPVTDPSAPEAAVAPVPAGAPPVEPGRAPDDRAPEAAAPRPALPTEPDTRPEPAATVPIRIDALRVTAEGRLTVAGGGPADATIEITANASPLGMADADRSGDWVYFAPQPLAPGAYELTFTARLPDGRVVPGDTAAILFVPERRSGDQAMAVLAPAGDLGPAEIVQAPLPTAPLSPPVVVPPPGDDRPWVIIEVVDYDSDGRVFVSGRTRPDGIVRIYLDGFWVAEGVADPDGAYSIELETRVPPGTYDLRVDQIDPAGRVVARAETRFLRAFTAADEITAVTIQPGNNLWTISRRVYGKGILYTVIYEANRDQIRDPDLIFPGQVFTLPRASELR